MITPHDLDLTADDLSGTVIATVLADNGKALLARGHRHGHPVVIKILRSSDTFWRDKFHHEIGVYQAFATTPPPVRVPELVHTDGHRVLILEDIPGDVIDTERYPTSPLTTPILDTVLDAVVTFAAWAPPAGALRPVFDYPDRIVRYHRAGFFDDADHAALGALLDEAGPADQVGHGDPLPANILLTAIGEPVLLDFEFTGLFLPGFDLALLHTLLAGTPGAQNAIDALVTAAGIKAPFLINQAVVLSRERRIHAELPAGEFRDERLALIEPQWNTLRHRLHTRS